MEPQEELHRFLYETTIGGKEYHYRITQNEANYGIEQDGVVIAEIAHADGWQQLSGEPIGQELLDSICKHIEVRYE